MTADPAAPGDAPRGRPNGPAAGPPDRTLLDARDLGFAYGPSTVLRGVSLTLRPGTLTAIVGPNGAGKSTLLRLLAGLLTPRAGTIALDGSPVRDWSPANRARRLAFVDQRPDVAFGFTVLDVVRFGLVASGAGGAASADLARNTLARVGLASRAADRFEHLSVGQQQRVALARALAQLAPDRPPDSAAVLLADEPVASMDPRHAMAGLGLIRTHTRGDRPAAAAVVLHDLTQAARFADEAIVLDGQGRVAAAGPARQVLTGGVLAPVFGVGFATLTGPGGEPVLVPTLPLD